MANKDLLNAHVILRLVEIYGIDYLKRKIKNCWYGVSEEGIKCRFIYLFEGTDGKNSGIINKKGWTVYAIIDIDKNTLETSVIEYLLPQNN